MFKCNILFFNFFQKSYINCIIFPIYFKYNNNNDKYLIYAVNLVKCYYSKKLFWVKFSIIYK